VNDHFDLMARSIMAVHQATAGSSIRATVGSTAAGMAGVGSRLTTQTTRHRTHHPTRHRIATKRSKIDIATWTGEMVLTRRIVKGPGLDQVQDV